MTAGRATLAPMYDDLSADARAAAVGAASGIAATGAMSLVMLGAQRAGLMSELPPHEIADDAVDRSPAEASEGERTALGWLLHFGFGAAVGGLYAVLRRHVRTPGPEALHGVGFALAVWAVSYLGWVPALRFLPPATRDEPGRPPAMVAAHVVFGALVGLLVRPVVRRRGA